MQKRIAVILVSLAALLAASPTARTQSTDPSQPQARSLQPAGLPPMNDWENIYIGPAWSLASALEFSPDQRAQIPELAERAGVRKCITEAEAAARKHGVPINRAETEKLTPEQRRRQGQSLIELFQELAPSDKRCSLNQVNFMEQVVDLASPEQRANHLAEIKAVRDLMAAKRTQRSVIR